MQVTQVKSRRDPGPTLDNVNDVFIPGMEKTMRRSNFPSTWRARALAAIAVAAFAGSAAAVDQGTLAHGGKLYDKWYKVIDADAPKESHALYPADGKYAAKADTNWRCKECHGWDYQGKDGAYAKGKHATGIPGIASMAGKDPAAIRTALENPPHGYAGKMDAPDLQALALFVSAGQVDMGRYIDSGSKAAKGDAARGKDYYETLCAQCHGDDGKKVKDMPPMGELATGNPWEVLHKILNGQPGEEMPALRALDVQVAVDVLRHAQDLPAK